MQEKDYHKAMTCAYQLTECHDPAAHMFVAHTLFIYHIQSPKLCVSSQIQAKEIDYKGMESKDFVTKVQQLLNTDETETKIDPNSLNYDEVRNWYDEMMNEYTESNKSGDDTGRSEE
eukprot:242817_1